ncbi:flavin-binding monooxygenase-like domain-containing protein [Trichoderma breve]|uniref:Flavin-binding monooxygenase-like domain-containing protein n=1 Tax=Trichoderma breve TaxID=2034170 RepID=A0A9W9B902_9HYPO|nr:flavin-binding monooxygenase-like domain-containing protein [Trichoderma breve]KAJ4855628.1 flavin-binding monooxygenase-like domain-containing protein [Trichoderma breve]
MTGSVPVRRVAVIGAGPAGAIAIDALAQEKAFDIIRVFERRERAGGCWIDDATRPPTLSNFSALASRTADTPLTIPKTLPAQTQISSQPRFSESSVYPYLETNIDHLPMEFSQEPIPEERSELSISNHGPDTPFRKWDVIQRYVQSLVDRRGYRDFVSYNTTVEKVEKIEWFDAVVVASGHFWVPYIPPIEGLEAFEKARPGSVIHSKHFRGREPFIGKRVVVVGASVSGADIAFDLVNTAQAPVHAITIGHTINGYFGGEAFNHPKIRNYPSIARVEGRTVHLVDGNSIANVDYIVFSTGYSWSMPFLPDVPVRNNRVPDLYQHVVWQNDPTLLFVGAVAAGLTFKVFEWQAVLAARLLAGRATLPPIEKMRRWETERIKVRGDGVKFTLIFPDFEDYFETLRELAGEGEEGKGRKLPKFQREWVRAFLDGHERRKAMWKRLNEKAQKELSATKEVNFEKARL